MNRTFSIVILLWIFLALPEIGYSQTSSSKQDNVPVPTQWLLDAAGETGRSAIKSVYMIECKASMSKGTGFLLQGGHIITAAHVITSCQPTDLIAYSPFGDQVFFTKALADMDRDLAIFEVVP
jgi:hypothetical protein